MYVKCFMLCRITTVIILTVFFVSSSLIIFKQYIEGKTITSSGIILNTKGKQVLPAIIICREKAYDKVTDMSKLNDFLNNTMKLEYYVDDEVYNPIEDNSTHMIRERVYSINRGHCVVLKYIKEVTFLNT